jgi:hypothetical protein
MLQKAYRAKISAADNCLRTLGAMRGQDAFIHSYAMQVSLRFLRREALGYFSNSSYGIGLGTFLALNDVEFHLVPFFQTLVSIELDSTVMDKHVRSIVAADKAVTLRVIEPLHFAFVLSH